MSNNVKEALRWLKQAEYDLLVAKHSARGGFHSTACFQAQQAAEKAGKAFLIAQGRRGYLGHSIQTIMKEISIHDPSFSDFISHSRKLDLYYIPTRYPDALPDGTPFEAYEEDDSVSAIHKTEEILNAIKAKIPED